MLDTGQGRMLIELARASIAARLRVAAADPLPPGREVPAWLGTPAATFVTLTQHGELRGCIGSLEAHRDLLDDVRANALAAAFGDPRFPPLGAEELNYTRIEVSLLSHPEPVAFRDEIDLLARLRPGIDGVILALGGQRATFLPQVWDQLPEPRQFLRQLKRKAGLDPEFWSSDLRVLRYGVQKFQEEAHGPA